MSKEVESSRFYSIVARSRGQQKGYSRIISKEVKSSRFYAIVEDSRGQ